LVFSILFCRAVVVVVVAVVGALMYDHVVVERAAALQPIVTVGPTCYTCHLNCGQFILVAK
jgi:hypothetical protein